MTATSSDGPKCPYCGFVHVDAEDLRDVVSYWGSEEGPVEFDCHGCSLTFEVHEIVKRSWESEAITQKVACND